ncbi:hypothetical protein [Halothiobacillus neapolitanus]|uniref:Thioredoxin-like fold domain-containing protein n=1 Tax=Halothiobacillus neapolitanus (strain ATCC 23641 / DSM 15147 / CIP 104769 / NCIMB 8539 / c2) TaxID=555778 RepID=D0KWY2_HALNC|nr:hypothetical protein [Halothiobacillus neapolitanus]ACX97102.1 hypothetical protein Hneap_2292 [Halothiobacillus neapolitanus c2]TDN58026.1 hypothetical protein C8D83_1093 [Halothiobacillus neapolitanus]
MLNARNFFLLAVLISFTALYPNQGRADDNDYATIVKEIYPAHYEKIPISYQDYQTQYRSFEGYLGDHFRVSDPGCVGGVVTLVDEVGAMYTVPPEVAGSIDKNVFFTWSHMLHGGTCQTGLVFSRDMKVKLVATYILGSVSLAGKITTPTVLTVYVKNPDDLKYLSVLERWAAAESRLTSAIPGMFAPKTYETRVYDLRCKTKGNRIDVPECRMHPAGLHAPSPAKSETQVWPSPDEHVNWAAMQSFWEQSMKLPGIDTGPADSPKHMLVYFDPNCPVCAQQWEQLIPYLDSVRIHWIPIAYFDKDSLSRAAALLAAAHPAQALLQNERAYDQKSHKGGYPIPSHIPSWARRAVQSNTREAERILGQIATPTLGFELEAGKKYYRFTGLMDATSIRTAVQALGRSPDSLPKQR